MGKKGLDRKGFFKIRFVGIGEKNIEFVKVFPDIWMSVLGGLYTFPGPGVPGPLA